MTLAVLELLGFSDHRGLSPFVSPFTMTHVFEPKSRDIAFYCVYQKSPNAHKFNRLTNVFLGRATVITREK